MRLPTRSVALLFVAFLASSCSSTGGSNSLPGDQLAPDVARIEGVHPASAVHCQDTSEVKAGVITNCDDGNTTWRITFDDSLGHFTIRTES